MSTARTVLKNTAVLAFAQVASIILGFLTLGYTGKYLGVNDFGVLNLALSITAIYASSSTSGEHVPNQGSRPGPLHGKKVPG